MRVNFGLSGLISLVFILFVHPLLATQKLSQFCRHSVKSCPVVRLVVVLHSGARKKIQILSKLSVTNSFWKSQTFSSDIVVFAWPVARRVEKSKLELRILCKLWKKVRSENILSFIFEKPKVYVVWVHFCWKIFEKICIVSLSLINMDFFLIYALFFRVKVLVILICNMSFKIVSK